MSNIRIVATNPASNQWDDAEKRWAENRKKRAAEGHEDAVTFEQILAQVTMTIRKV
jgi:hypothetical protein